MFLIVAIMAARLSSPAQVFIPTTWERSWLNQALPGIVDANGIMDTSFVGIGSLDSLSIQSPFLIAPVEAVGLRYLDSLTTLSVMIGGSSPQSDTVRLLNFPSALRSLQFLSDQMTHVHFGPLPAGMQDLNVSCTNAASSLYIEQLPHTLARMTISGFPSPIWNGACHVERLELNPTSAAQDLILPALETDHLLMMPLGGNNVDTMDLSAISTRYFQEMPSYHNGPVSWPSQMDSLFSFGYFPSSMGMFPNNLRHLNFQGYVQCLPHLPDALAFVIMDPIVCLPNWPLALNDALVAGTWVDASTANLCSILNTSCPGTLPGISGSVFMDLNGDGLQAATELGVPGATVSISPGGSVLPADELGHWEHAMQPGNYTITPNDSYPYAVSTTPGLHLADLADFGTSDTDNHFAVSVMNAVNDLSISLCSEPAVPGLDNRVYFQCTNQGTTDLDAEVSFSFPGIQSAIGNSLPPSASSGNTMNWVLGTLAAGETISFHVDLITALDVELGTPVTYQAMVVPVSNDANPGNNSSILTAPVVGSYDPNDKHVVPEVLSSAVVGTGSTPLEYTIRFQNTGTFSAQRVIILDTLSQDLQWNTMRFLSSSHNCTWYINAGVLHVVHDNIHLPDSTSDEPNSHGFVKFSMLPFAELTNGDSIINVAHIVFDFNEPVMTAPCIFRVDDDADVGIRYASARLAIHPNPASEILFTGAGSGSYVIRDVLGRTVIEGHCGADGAIPVGSLDEGNYYIQLIGPGGPEIHRATIRR